MTGPLDELPTWLLSQAATRSHQVMQRRLAELGFRGFDYRVLHVLAARGPMTQAEIGRQARLDRGDVTHVVSSLEDRRLVLRRPVPRQRWAEGSLSSRGTAVWDQAQTVMAGIQAEVFAAFDEAELQLLASMLRRVATETGRASPEDS